jgi:hypothetical protein
MPKAIDVAVVTHALEIDVPPHTHSAFASPETESVQPRFVVSPNLRS